MQDLLKDGAGQEMVSGLVKLQRTRNKIKLIA